MNKTLLGILCLHICLLIGLSQSRQARMSSEWKSKRSIGARDGGQQKFPSPEVDPCERKKRAEQSGRDIGQQKFPSPDPCNRKKRSDQSGRDGGQQKSPSPEEKRTEQSGRDGGQQKFPSSEEKRSGIVSDIDPTLLQAGLGIDEKAELNPYNRMGNLQKRLNPHHRMAPDFAKRSAKRLHAPELNFNELFQQLEEGNNDDAIIVEGKRDNSNLFRPLPKDPEEEGKVVEVKRLNPHHTKPYQTDFDKRSAQADWQDLPDVFQPLNEFTDKATNGGAIGPVDFPDVVRPQRKNPKIPVKTGKRGKYVSSHNRMANLNQFNQMGNLEKRLNQHEKRSVQVPGWQDGWHQAGWHSSSRPPIVWRPNDQLYFPKK